MAQGVGKFEWKPNQNSYPVRNGNLSFPLIEIKMFPSLPSPSLGRDHDSAAMFTWEESPCRQRALEADSRVFYRLKVEVS